MKRTFTRRGFTLVELMVSLVAGLIVTIAVVGLARTAITTFYEQARLSTTESSVRTAAERLRQDLSRASFMSTGNIKLATAANVSVPFGQKISTMPGAATGSRDTSLNDLQGIRIIVDGSPFPLSAANGLSPDALELTGNFTTDDAYRGKIDGNVITLTVASDVAVARLLAGPDPDRAIRNAFQPGTVPPAAAPPFAARVVDPRGCVHFVIVSAVSGSTTGATITLASPSGGGSPVLTPAEDKGTCGANPQEEVSISPLQKVRWFLAKSSDALKQPDPNIEDADAKFDLYREILDANGTRIPSPGGPQVVAEYAIDLKFGITVDDPATPAPNNLKIYNMDKDATEIVKWNAVASSTTEGLPGPQRIRSVRFRIATRAALDDRKQDMKIYPVEAPQYLSRYCTKLPLATCVRWARVRTITSEVTLMNQIGMLY